MNRRVALPWLAAALLVALMALLVAHPAQPVSAQAPSALVSNLGQRSQVAINSSVPVAQAFRTGAHGGGYVIHTIELDNRANGRPFRVSLWEVDSHGVPTTRVTSDFVTASDFSTGTVVFTAPVNIPLDASTSYAVVIHSGTSAGMSLGLTASRAEDSGAASGWSIGDNRLLRDALEVSAWYSVSNPIRVAIKGQTINSLVSNTGQTTARSPNFTQGVSQSFQAGGTNTVTSIEVAYADSEGDEYDASIWFVDGNRRPRSKIRDLEPPDNFAAGTLEFTVPGGGLQVGGGGVYAVVFQPRGTPTNGVTLEVTTSDNEDSGASGGWSIDNTHAQDQSGTWSSSATEALKIAVKGFSGHAPGAPGDPSAGYINGDRVLIQWTAASAGSQAIDNYLIEVSTDAGATWSQLTTVGSTATSHTDTRAEPHDNVRYRVSAFSALGMGNRSDALSVDPNGISLVRNLGQTPATDEHAVAAFALTYTSGGTYTVKSIVMRYADPQRDEISASIWTVDSSRLPRSKLRDLDPPDTFATGTLEFTVPGGGLHVGNLGIYAVVFQYEDSATDGMTIGFTTSDNEDAGAHSGWSIGDDYAYEDSGRWFQTTNDLAMRIGVKGYSGHAPGAPTGLTALATGQSRIYLSWTAPTTAGSSAISGYRIQVSTDGATWANLVADTGSTGTTYVHTGMPAGAARHYRVRAINATGAGPPSNTAMETANVLVSNTFQPDPLTTVMAGGTYSQGFTAGSHSDGYALTAIEVVSIDAEGDDFTAELYAANANGVPTGTATALTAPSGAGAFAAGRIMFTAPAGTKLASGGTYAVVIKRNGSGNVTLPFYASDAEDPGKASGFSIADTSAFNTFGTWVTAGRTESLAITVRGHLNSAPVFADATVTRSIPENTAASQNVGAAVAATDADTSDMLTYTLGGTDAASFTIDSTSGQIQTKSGVTYDFESKQTYTVTVTASDGLLSATATVTITITDVDEPPSTPAAPTVSSVSGDKTRLSVTWTAPANTGPDISGYDLRYRAGSSGNWSDGPQNVSATSTTITGLNADTTYQVQVRATNDEGDSGWSASGLGTTSSNKTPVFADATVTRSIPENTAASRNVGAAIAATDADTSDTLTYTLGGTDAASFTIDSTSGQIQTKSGVTYDFEAKASYTVTVTASDGAASATAMVTITITDVDEPPSAPAAPTVSAVADSKTSLSVTWTAPVNTGKPDISGYDVGYIEVGGGNQTSALLSVSGTSATITGLNAGTTYQVQVRATNDEGDSGWSASSSGTTNGNRQPVFADATVTRSIPENTAKEQNVGAAVAATDADTSDTLTYTLGGTDAASFTIDSTSGQIQTKDGVAYDFESKQTYTVTVTASDGTASATATVTITITDVDEPPSAPAAPTVWPLAGNSTSLTVTWTAPSNTGPDISGYDLRYRQGTSSSWTNGPQDVSGTSATITGLSAGTTYRVQVRATNDEGDSGWSTSGSGTPVANAPVIVSFGSATYAVTEGGTVSVSVNLIANPGSTFVIPITATTQGGASSADYSGVPASVTFSSGETSQVFTFTATADMDIEVGESVLLGFGASLPTGVNAGTTTASTVSITDTGPVIAITSSPSDDAYTTLDVITVSATFSEAVTVTGHPQLALDIGGTERIAEYAEPGASTGQLLFRYTVQPTDQDDDGIGVKQGALTLNGGAIRAADDSADASLAILATSFAEHKVDTELVLIGNMEQTAGTPLRINAGETIKLNFDYGYFKHTFYEGAHILLDVQTPSDTLTLTVIAKTIDLYRLSGSVAEAGVQAFRSDRFTVEHLYSDNRNVELLLKATGSGYVELGTTSSTDADEAKAYEWSIGDSFSKSTDGTTFVEQTGDMPRFSVIGHAREVLRIDAAAVISEPADQSAYTAGEDIEVLVFTSAPPWPTTETLTIPLQVGANVRQAELVTIGGNFNQHAIYGGLDSFHFERQVMHFVYTVQPGDTATGVGIGADPLGSAGIEHAADSRFARDLSFPAQAPAAGSRVDGSRAEACMPSTARTYPTVTHISPSNTSVTQ